MNQLKNLRIVILAIGVLLVLVIVRSTNPHIFKQKVKSAIEAAQNNSNIITPGQLNQLTTPYLVIDLGSPAKQNSPVFQHSVQIPFEKLLDKANRKILQDATGSLILFSEDLATASKAWVILNQMGYKNLKILTPDPNQEVLKYKFQPDTTARLEQDSM
jgi:hypothetical protein